MPREFKTILCPLDFSDESHRAVPYAVRFARESGGKLLLLHVIHVPSGELYQEEGRVLTFEEARQRALDRLRDIRQAYAATLPDVELLTDVGDPAEQVVRVARQRDVDLIVLSTHGQSSLEHILVGSVAEGIMRHAPCPIFVVRRGAD